MHLNEIGHTNTSSFYNVRLVFHEDKFFLKLVEDKSKEAMAVGKKHFNKLNISIHALHFGEEKYFKTAELARTCSFQGSGQYFCELMRKNYFCDFEKVFAACNNSTVIGFCALTKASCSQNDFNYPWLDFLFVSEEFRNHGIARSLIKTVAEYATSLSFKELFLCTASHEKFYEQFGFETIYDTKINEFTIGKVMKMPL